MTVLVERFDPENMGFTVGRDIVVSFEVREFLMVMGLRCSGVVLVDSRRSMAE